MASPYHTYDAECSSGGGQLHGEKAALGEQGQRKRHEGAPGQLLLQKPSLGLLLMFKLSSLLSLLAPPGWFPPTYYITWATDGQAGLAFLWSHRHPHSSQTEKRPWAMLGATINKKLTDFPGDVGNSLMGSVDKVQLQVTRGTNPFKPLASFKRMYPLGALS